MEPTICPSQEELQALIGTLPAIGGSVHFYIGELSISLNLEPDQTIHAKIKGRSTGNRFIRPGDRSYAFMSNGDGTLFHGKLNNVSEVHWILEILTRPNQELQPLPEKS